MRSVRLLARIGLTALAVGATFVATRPDQGDERELVTAGEGVGLRPPLPAPAAPGTTWSRPVAGLERGGDPCMVPVTPPTLAPYRFDPLERPPVPDGLPRHVAALRDNGQLVLLDATGGRLVRVLADPVLAGAGSSNAPPRRRPCTFPSPSTTW